MLSLLSLFIRILETSNTPLGRFQWKATSTHLIPLGVQIFPGSTETERLGQTATTQSPFHGVATSQKQGLSHSGSSLGNIAGQKQVLAGDRFKQQVSVTSTFRAVPLAVSTVYESDYVVGKSPKNTSAVSNHV